MFSLNRATIIGNLTRDPEVRYTPNGQAVASFAVATNRRWKNQQGETQDDTQYHEVVAWGKLAEITQQLFSKGKKIYVEGRIQTRNWDAPDGTKRSKTEIVAENVIALSPKSAGDGGSDFLSQAPESPLDDDKPTKSSSSPLSSPKSTKSDSSTPAEDDGEIKLEDIPF